MPVIKSKVDGHWHHLSLAEVIKKLKTSAAGLAVDQAQNNLKKFGRNELPQQRGPSVLVVFFRQFTSVLIVVLLIAAALSASVGEVVDAVVILAAVLANAIVGWWQEQKAEAALQELQRFIQHYVRVNRSGKETNIPVEELVPGDLVNLVAGDRVPADIRLSQAFELEVNEAHLTGESQPAEKKPSKLAPGTVLAERSNMLYMGSLVTRGQGQGLVVATGAVTELGKLATSLSDITEVATPLTEKLSRFGRGMGIVVVVLSVIVLLLGVLLGYAFKDIFTLAVAIAVSAVPEGLAIVVTAILALGMRRTLQRHALVRRLVAAETLGSTTVICVDKTGTLTAGEMRVVKLITPDGETASGKEKLADGSVSLRLLKVGALSSHAYLENPKDNLSEPVVVGSPTERALLLAAQEAGLEIDGLRKELPLLAEVPFSSERKYMLTLHQSGSGKFAYLKGAPEITLAYCSYLLKNGRRQRFSPEARKKILRLADVLFRRGLRLLLLAELKLDSKVDLADLEKTINGANYTFLGIVALQDPLRSEVVPTIARARAAGIKVIMITGDHKLTAQTIATEVGLPAGGEAVIDGSELQKIDDSKLRERIAKVMVYARAVPSDKLRIINAWQARGEVVAMTGDGVNDAPALKAADIGVALGSGSDVAKEAADMVLLDNNFNSIVAAVEEGRTIFQNIRKVVLYLVSDSFSEVILMCGAFAMSLFANEPLALPILATQILWINFVSDTFPAIALAADPPNEAIMQQPPIRRNEPILDPTRRLLVAMVSTTKGFGSLALFLLLIWLGRDIANVRTIVFTVMALSSLAIIFSLKHLHHSLFHRLTWNNHKLIIAVLFGIMLQLLVIYLPWGNRYFHTAPLPASDWLLVLALPLLSVALLELVKFGLWTRQKSSVKSLVSPLA
ncbi:MAG TPA: hypothetical protein DDW92_01635 [Candidatus Veblenbacteria bacterium]|nr:hypothetical protein [Candidatus Veblenbacteria bacterium]